MLGFFFTDFTTVADSNADVDVAELPSVSSVCYSAYIATVDDFSVIVEIYYFTAVDDFSDSLFVTTVADYTAFFNTTSLYYRIFW